MRFVVLLFLVLPYFIACSSGVAKEYFIGKNSAYVATIEGKCAMVRTYYCDVLVENLRTDEWNRLQEFEEFRGEGRSYPLESGFHVIVSNIWNRPIVVHRVVLSWEGQEIEPQFFEAVKSPKFFTDRYNINLNALWKTRRLLCEDNLLTHIDFDEEAIDYNLKFIAPGDRVSLFYLFDYVPPQVDDFKLSITIKYNDFKKVIDFEMKRSDYRDSFDSVESLY